MPEQIVQASPPPWSERAVHDTVHAIMQQSQYRRSLTDTLWMQFMRWLSDVLTTIRSFFAGSHTGRVILWVMFAILVFLIVARLFINERGNAEARIPHTRGRARNVGSDALRDAERLAAEGSFTLAAHALFAALLNTFAARGEVRLHPSKTTGDYARELRRREAPSLGGFLAFRARYDRVIYGLEECTADEFQTLLSYAHPLLADDVRLPRAA